MCKSVVTIVMMVLVVGLVGPGLAQDGDPNLVGWWKFDGDALDASGSGHDGSLVGAAGFVTEGMSGGALALYNNGYVNIDGWTGVLGASPITVTAWVKTTSMGTGDTGSNSCDAIVGWGPNGTGTRFGFRVNAGRIRTEHHAGNSQGDTVMADGRWHHVAVTVEANATISYPEVILYLDGEDDTRPGTDPDAYDIQPGPDVRIGSRASNGDRFFNGLIDEVRIYNRTLTGEEIKALAVWPKAYNPTPADGAVGVTIAMLSWEPRQTALFHDVYLGTSPDLGPDNLVAARQTFAMYFHGPGLEPGTTYYWKVDEIDPDETVRPGDLWSFTAMPLEAFGPDPVDGAPNIDPNLTLSWTQGLNGVSHDVYFGTDETAVAEGTGDTFRGNQYGTSFATGDLEPGTTYYWRVDEVDAGGAKVTGRVWSFATLPEIPITDPNLVAYWNFDEGVGFRATDLSGHGNHGTFEGDPTWVEGYDGYALELDGVDDSIVRMLGEAEWPAFTVSLWVKAAMVSQDVWSSPYSGYTPNSAGFQLDVDGTYPGNYRVNPGGILIGTVTTDWVHLAVTGTGTAAKVYYNGLWTASGTLGDAMFNIIAIGRNRGVDNRFAGLIDDVRVFDRELTQEELEKVMQIDPLRAWQPHPGDNAIADVRTASPLTWAAGDSAAQHDVYLGDDEAAVAPADASDTTGVYRGRQGTTSYMPAEGIEWGKSYAWRIDELNQDGSLTRGRVWKFTVADYLIVDDFESYTDDIDAGKAIFQTWIDGWENGTGSLVGYLEAPFAEQTIVFSGRQSMPVEYNNVNTPWYSEAERTWDVPQDWLFNDVNTLVLRFHGAPVAFVETAPGSVTMSAAGTDIWGTADQCRFAYRRLNGDGSIVARVDSIANSHVWAKGGVMIRESLDPGSRFAMVVVSPGSGVAFQRRLADSIDAIGTTESGILAPHWVKLTRTGNELTAQHSADGVTWGDVIHATNPTSDTVVMGGTLYIGLALTSHSAGNVTTAEFSGIEMAGNVTGPWQVAEIGVDHPGNSPDSLYIAVEDTAGRTAVAPHPDPGAVLYESWRPWTVDLADLIAAGVNLRAVKTMYIGVGDRDNPQPTGAGRVYIDDIRITQGVPVEPNNVEVVE